MIAHLVEVIVMTGVFTDGVVVAVMRVVHLLLGSVGHLVGGVVDLVNPTGIMHEVHAGEED